MDMVKNLLQILINSDIQVSHKGELKVKLAGNIHLVCDGLYLQANDINITSKNIATNSCVSVATLDAYSITTNSLSSMSTKASGTFAGTLKGGCTYSSIVTMTPGDYPEPACDEPEVPTPDYPNIDF